MAATSIQTSQIIGVSNVRMAVRGAFHRCPVCGGGHVIRRWFGIVDRCPTCNLRYERIEGHQLGYIGLNTVVTFGSTFIALLVTAIIMTPDIRTGPLLVIALIPAAVFPILLLPSCRLVWTALDLVMRPLRPEEVDPRFIELDPTRR